MSDADWRDRLKQQWLQRSRFWVTLVLVSLSCAAGGLSVLTTRSTEAPPQEVSAPPPSSAALAPAPASDSPSASEVSPVAKPGKAPLVLIITEGEISPGQTLSSSLRARGVSAAAVHLIATEMAPVFDFRYAHPGDSYRLTQDENGDVVFFRYSRSPLEHYTIERQAEGYHAAVYEPELVRRRARIAGVVSTTLYEAVEALGEEAELANDFAEIFAWDVDFSRTVQPGDEFTILYERLLLKGDDGSETYVRPGRILAGRYTTGLQEYTAVYFEQAEGKGGYYRTDGSSVRRQLLRAPLNYRRVSSRFSHSRLHPILKVRRPHLGVDYAAPYGAPVWAVADGKVIFRGVKGGLGKLVKVRHANGYVSYYGHLSRFPQGLRVGQWVHQKQLIGYVGSTGISTGPHLHYQLMKYGRAVDPAVVRTPAGDPIPDAARARFAEVRDGLLRELDPTPLVILTNEAG